ncbi:hypothetical protein MtrunA17_Chr7g0258481 [Medicago truncatula]|uniref:Transmembrane protein n=1 Tax=Medicago truncatula TaxID=3880 RepID=A0A396HAJ4_MEDTR|nr:hypothetical protein MtrunA17_Chr7g0258481 [Medicago truncatula]
MDRFGFTGGSVRPVRFELIYMGCKTFFSYISNKNSSLFFLFLNRSLSPLSLMFLVLGLKHEDFGESSSSPVKVKWVPAAVPPAGTLTTYFLIFGSFYLFSSPLLDSKLTNLKK